MDDLSSPSFHIAQRLLQWGNGSHVRENVPARLLILQLFKHGKGFPHLIDAHVHPCKHIPLVARFHLKAQMRISTMRVVLAEVPVDS